ncbi:hypothetical protein PFLmoz3_03352 [Pseudomonas fluorescens]|uniref:Uncharacterized protein n=1 Tax=Pseudomonas fluorescens TaxID=294 RepID=A0A109LFH5_PSEFL|nr:hypothetical protein PFLmoz3_03352 [Pseudomonas fluorescens]
MNEVTGAHHGEQHQPHRQCQDRATQVPQLTLGHAPTIGKQQWRQEQKQEQLRVQRHMQPQRGPGQQGAGGDLHQGQGQWDDAPDQARKADQHQQDKNGVGGLHNAGFPDNRLATTHQATTGR